MLALPEIKSATLASLGEAGRPRRRLNADGEAAAAAAAAAAAPVLATGCAVPCPLFVQVKLKMRRGDQFRRLLDALCTREAS